MTGVQTCALPISAFRQREGQHHEVLSKLRGVGQLVAAEEVKGGAVQAIVRVTVEIEGSDRPGCVVDTISRMFFG